MHFFRKPGHVIPQMDWLGKTSPVVRVSTHIYGVFEEIDWKMFIFWVNLDMWPPQIDHLGKTSTVLRVSTDIYGVSREIDGKTFIFRVHLGMWPLELIVSEKKWHRWENIHFSTKPRHVTPQINCLGKTSTVLRVSTHIFGVSKEIGCKTFIFRVNLGMWPLKSIALEKWPKTCTLNLQVLHNTKRPRKWSGHMKMIDPPTETST